MAKYNRRITQAYGLTSPLLGVFPEPIRSQRAPTVNDRADGGQVWIDEVNDDIYMLSRVLNNQSIWVMIANSLSDLDTLTPDVGTSPVVPDATHNIGILGGTNITSVGGASVLTLNLDDAIVLATSVSSPLYTSAAGLDTAITAAAGQDIDITMGDAAGANNVTFLSSTPAAVVSIDSLGQYVGVNVECGTNLARETEYTTNLSIIQAFADDDTAAGASSRSAIYGNMQPTAGDGNGTPNAIYGYLDGAAGSNTLQVNGVYGLCQQEDGSVIASTAAGVEGHLNLLETDIADLPAVYAFAVKGYLDSNDAAGVPAGIVAGVGSIVEYNTPFDAKAFGVAVSRLDAGGGAGAAGRAAFGVVQGTVAADDWLYGLDFSAATEGFTNGEVIFSNSSTVQSDTEGVSFSGDIEARSLSATNTRIQSFYANPLGQLSGQAGALMTGATGTVNDLVFQEGLMMQNFMIGAGQTKIIPVMEADGLEIALDLTATEGQEMNFGVLASSKHAYTIGTSPAFFFEATFKVADVSGCEPLVIGFRKQEANNGTWTAYTDYATIGIVTSENADVITLATELNAGGTTYTNTTDAFTDGQTHTLRVNVSAAGVVTYLIDGVAPTQTAAFTFDNADVVMPFIHLVHAVAAPGKIHMINMACGLQAWN